MVHGKNRIPYRIDRRLTGLAGPDYDATISFGLPLEPEDSQYGKSRLLGAPCSGVGFAVSKPLSQIHRSTLLPLQDTDPTPSFGGFGLRGSDTSRFTWGSRLR